MYRFGFVLLCIWGQFFKYKPPGSLYLEGRFNGGFFALPVRGAYIWRGLYMEGLIFEILRYLDNTKHVIFGFGDMKQLNFRHFNTNSKQSFETVIFFQKEAKTAQKRPILFCLVYQGVFGHFTTIPDYFRRFPKATDDSRRLTKRSDHCRRCPKNPPNT